MKVHSIGTVLVFAFTPVGFQVVNFFDFVVILLSLANYGRCARDNYFCRHDSVVFVCKSVIVAISVTINVHTKEENYTAFLFITKAAIVGTVFTTPGFASIPQS